MSSSELKRRRPSTWTRWVLLKLILLLFLSRFCVVAFFTPGWKRGPFFFFFVFFFWDPSSLADGTKDIVVKMDKISDNRDYFLYTHLSCFTDKIATSLSLSIVSHVLLLHRERGFYAQRRKQRTLPGNLERTKKILPRDWEIARLLDRPEPNIFGLHAGNKEKNSATVRGGDDHGRGVEHVY